MNGLFYLVSVMIWGTTWYAIRMQVESGASFDYAVGYRFILAAFILLPLVAFSKRYVLSLKNHGWALAQGITMFGGNFGLIYYASQFMESGFIAVIYSTLVLFNIINGAILFKNPVRLNAVIGGVLGIIGVACIFLPTLLNTQANNATIKGFFFALLGTFVASLGNVISARNQKHNMNIMSTNTWGMLYGGVFMCAIAFLRGSNPTFPLSPDFLGSLVYLSFVGSIVAFTCYIKLVGRIGLDKAAYVIVLTPIVALFVSTLLEHFTWQPHTYVGVAIVLLGNCVMLLPKKLIARFQLTPTPAQDF